MAAASKLKMKLLIDKDKKRVVLAESDNDLVDILFSFLTLPMGTIIRLLGKQSNLGCFDKLYESVENLDTNYLQTEACKTILLHPINAAEYQCENLAIQVDDTQPRRGFLCVNKKCWSPNTVYASTVKNTRCKCGEMMFRDFKMEEPLLEGEYMKLDKKKVFVKDNLRFLISDNLQIMPASTDAGNFLLNKLGVSSGTIFDEQMVEFGRVEVLNLLKCSLQSSTPLTDVFMPNPERTHVVKLEVEDEIEVQDEKEMKMEADKIKVKLFLCKSDNKVLYGEAGEDFADLLFSLLVLPLGSIAKYFAGNSSMVSIDNLYKSVEELKVGECMISEDCKSMLLSPKLASFFGCDNQLIQTTDAEPPRSCYKKFCKNCCWFSCLCSTCSNNMRGSVYTSYSTNPKKPNNANPNSIPAVKTEGRRYTKGAGKFMVTDEMVVTSLSFMTIMNEVHQLKKPYSVVQEKEVYLGKAEMFALLKATLSTRNALSSAFLQKKLIRITL